jgi:hypothetical protein
LWPKLWALALFHTKLSGAQQGIRGKHRYIEITCLSSSRACFQSALVMAPPLIWHKVAGISGKGISFIKSEEKNSVQR